MHMQTIETDQDRFRSVEEWTYFIQSEDGGPIKIGFTTKEPEHRLCQLQTGSPTKLRIVGLLPVDREKELHKKFASHHSHGEWFNPVKQVIDFIKREASAHLEQRLVTQARLKLEAITVPVGGVGRQEVSGSNFDRLFLNDYNLLEQMVEYWDFPWDLQEGEDYDDESLMNLIIEICDVCDDAGSFIEGVGVNADAGLFGFVCGPCNSGKRMQWLRDLGELADLIANQTPELFLFAVFWSKGRQIGIDLLKLATVECRNNEHIFCPAERFSQQPITHSSA
jgi:hypothetical protein